MKSIYPILFFYILVIKCTPSIPVSNSPQPQFQLASPNMEFSNILFKQPEKVRLFLHLENTQIRYTTDGSTPTPSSKLYTQPITLDASCLLKAKAFHPDFKPSDIASQQFIQAKKKITAKSVRFEEAPTSNYPGKAADLIDLNKGTLNFREEAWLAFKSDATIYIELEQPTTIQKVMVSSLSDAGSWILPPSGIVVETSNDGQAYSTIAQKNIPVLSDYEPAQLVFPVVELPNAITTSFLKITIQFSGLLPEWHSGKGYASWLFLDEVIFE